MSLRGYDEDSRYPVDSDYSFTRYFFPDLFDEGFRLEQVAEELYELFINLRRERSIHTPLNLSMQYFTRVIEYILMMYGVDSENVKKITLAHMKEAIQFTNFVQAEQATHKFT
ncbi:hypothetical protein [Metabacillus hrfriensis]|uniref:Uncharacterized protein n=1 Tax=Metabacillus hrfriensis TaxID=3048891 RepID=A0ACD4RHU3_9BACI|nr:hypothetical protein [Metabacillus sp. CT-WN-B3]WHZ60075.1 hypothetical protein QLQ22_12400 [Metabacillus sp. CT-WN-B3]